MRLSTQHSSFSFSSSLMLPHNLTSRSSLVRFELTTKVHVGIALIVSIFLLVLANLIFIAYTVFKGKEALKESIKKAKLNRIEQEEKERQEEEERKAKKKKEEEEFSSKFHNLNDNPAIGYLKSYTYSLNIELPDETNNVS